VTMALDVPATLARRRAQLGEASVPVAVPTRPARPTGQGR
jgi:hypothetical protein